MSLFGIDTNRLVGGVKNPSPWQSLHEGDNIPIEA